MCRNLCSSKTDFVETDFKGVGSHRAQLPSAAWPHCEPCVLRLSPQHRVCLSVLNERPLTIRCFPYDKDIYILY